MAPVFTLEEFFLAGFLAVVIGMAAVIAAKLYLDIVFTCFRDKLLDVIESIRDLANLQRWLDTISNLKKHLFFSLTYGIVVGVSLLVYFSIIGKAFIGFGPTIAAMSSFFIAGMAAYLIVLSIILPARLSRYHLKLYAADPSSSEVIDQLSDVLSISVYIMAVLAAIVTLYFVFFEIFTLAIIILLFLLAWGPLTALFVINQYALARIITRGKWKTLNGIQAQVEELQAEGPILSEETLGHIDKLMDYHDRIKATRNSALDLRAGLNFLNSLLLPILAFTLANLERVLMFLFNSE